MNFTPSAGQNLTVTLPGELMRALVKRVVDRNTVFVELGQPLSRSHTFRKGDLVACRRTKGVLGESWEAIENRAPPSVLPDEPAKSKRKS